VVEVAQGVNHGNFGFLGQLRHARVVIDTRHDGTVKSGKDLGRIFEGFVGAQLDVVFGKKDGVAAEHCSASF
jgi:hypothetical protein